MALLQRKLYFSNDPEGVQHFPGGPTFFRGVQILISIKTRITCDFPGEFGPPIPSGSAHVNNDTLLITYSK